MEFKNSKIIGTSCLMVLIVCFAVAQSAPNNSTAPANGNGGKNVTDTKLGTTTVANFTTSGNKTANGEEEDCEPEAEPESTAGGKNGTRQGKELTQQDKDKYKTGDGAAAEPEAIGKTNATKTGAHPGDAAKLHGGNSSTATVAPAVGGSATFAPSSLWANVIFATLLSAFTYPSL